MIKEWQKHFFLKYIGVLMIFTLKIPWFYWPERVFMLKITSILKYQIVKKPETNQLLIQTPNNHFFTKNSLILPGWEYFSIKNDLFAIN
ncbi:MAG: hypothetical protein CMH46_18920 [Muricauda sp.]|nr:hypothetical protein [Allomuricauda sp.]|tara:strand:- start:17235 stop:17501 length:267 start_codon:yes stop_codon:yes gene_type:complete